jgi:cytoskeletal protein CcmA (bactofilin family)
MKRVGGALRCGLVMVAAALMCALYVAPARAASAQQVFDRTYSLRQGGAFALANVNGGVRIEGWDREQVEVKAVKTALHQSEDLNRVQIEVQSDGEQVGVNTKYPSGSGVQVTVEYEIHVPYRLRWAAVSTVNGDVHVQGVRGAGTLNSVNGNVEVVDSEGRFNGITTNGDVRMQLRSVPQGGPVSLRTINGSVVLSIPQGTNLDVRVVNRNGDFRSDFPLTTLGAYTSSRFRGRMGAGGGEVFMSTVNGAIRLVNGHPVV